MPYQNVINEFKIDTGAHFTLDAGFSDGSQMHGTSLDGFLAALDARDIEAGDLTAEQQTTFAESAMLVDAVDDLKIETVEDVEAIFGGKLDLEIVENFQSVDGTSLNGGATADGKIILDADLSGEELRSVLKEEIAEAAFYTAFNSASKGDFGAEVVARDRGVIKENSLAQFQSENDTVVTEFGEVQANETPQINQLMNGISIASTNGTPYNTIADNGFSISEFQYNALAPGSTLKSAFGQEAFQALRWSPNQTDLDGDGKTSSAIEWAIVDTSPAGDVLSFSNSRLTPVAGLSDRLAASQGDASNTWVAGEQQTYRTAKSFNWDASLSVGTNIGGNFFGLEAGAAIEISASVGAGAETTNEFKTIREVRRTYNVDGQDYAPGTNISYGWHAQLADADVRDGYAVYAKVSDADGVEGYVGFDVTQRGIINDYLSGIVATDVDATQLA
ncbi:hypothetical protein [uncultured Roseobacter sp.]|uniref:hypothetical protein n=1 Tax=uncultured Roseobacter sp. TaxID=114847 RepID=UPI0026234D4F|nr:hypothetical protein [uncultured Roseobacter sp.]